MMNGVIRLACVLCKSGVVRRLSDRGVLLKVDSRCSLQNPASSPLARIFPERIMLGTHLWVMIVQLASFAKAKPLFGGRLHDYGRDTILYPR